MNEVVSHKHLIVWQKAIALACKVYAASRPIASRLTALGDTAAALEEIA
jgi:hypothetical protein